MITCLLCENKQDKGLECVVCGRAFSEEHLEKMGYPKLEPQPLPGLEPTRLDEQKAGSVSISPDMPCNWCGHRQRIGRLCDSCGRHRHKGIARKRDELEEPKELQVVCPECGTPSPPPRCFNCGCGLRTPD